MRTIQQNVDNDINCNHVVTTHQITSGFLLLIFFQWRNRRGQAGRVPPPPDFWLGNFCWPTRKREARKKVRQGKKVKMGQKRKKIGKGKVEHWKWKEEKLTFFFFFFCFSVFKTTEICFACTKVGISYRKKHFTQGKKSRKINLPPLKNIPLTLPFFFYFFL